MAFCVGTCTDKICAAMKQDLPLPVYLQAIHNASSVVASHTRKEDNNSNNDNVLSSPVIRLKNNLFLLASSPESLDQASIWSLPIKEHQPELVLVNCPKHVRVDGTSCQALLDNLKHVSYKGCDVLLSHELPQGAERILPDDHSSEENTNSSNNQISFDVADIALRARSRYHVVPATTFQQSPPFAHLAATTNTVSIHHVGRIITMAPVLVAPPKGKPFKSVHALGIAPLHALSTAELAAQRPATVLDCPFTDASYHIQNSKNATSNISNSKTNVGLSEASARRILAEEKNQQSGMPSQRWQQPAHNNSKRTREQIELDIDPTNLTLFLHGLHKDVTGQLQQNTAFGDDLILKALSTFQARRVRKPPGAETSSFCFVDFDTHHDAKVCWEALNGHVTINGVQLAVNWADGNKKQKQDGTSNKPHRLTETEAKDSSTIYFKVPGSEDIEKHGEAVRKWAEETLEDALADGGEKVTTAKDEPALQVQVRLPQTDVSYGFLDFASHAAGSMALASLTGSTDGGLVLEDALNRPEALNDTKVYLNWSKARVDNEANLIEDASGFKFERKHFPADSRQDCWFCLASQSCEKHLITGVFDKCYAAMPKGPIHQGHVLLIPVQHTGEGALNDPDVASEMDELKDKLRQHASETYNMDLFVFERAIQTKGGYHTHVQCIPVERKLGIKLQTTMQAQAKKVGFALREMNSDLALSSVLKNNDGDEEGDMDGYFYAEIPTTGKEYKRFLYTSKQSSRVMVPLQFGREVLAAVLGKPELAHWKSCVVDQDQEAEIAAAFRESFLPKPVQD